MKQITTLISIKMIFYYLSCVKYLSFIFAVLVLLLSTAPNLMEGKYFEKQNTEIAHDGHADNDCSHCCSPFMGCSTCLGFNLPTATFSLNIIVTFPEKKVSLYSENVTSDFFASIWQPPKIV